MLYRWTEVNWFQMQILDVEILIGVTLTMFFEVIVLQKSIKKKEKFIVMLDQQLISFWVDGSEILK